MTNARYQDQSRSMIEYKQSQSKNNQESIFVVLHELDKPVSTTEIKQYLDQKSLHNAESQAELKYNNCEITFNEIKEYVNKNARTIDLRTVQRWLKVLVEKGFVERKNNKYLLSITGKRELQFREFAQGYGTVALNTIMDCHFPTTNSQEENLSELVEMFGIYVVYCLIEATRLIAANKKGQEEHWHSSYFGASSNFKDGKFREGKLVNTWIKDIFNPWYMLNLFLTAISNAAGNKRKASSIKHKDKENLLKEYWKEYEKYDSSQISGLSVDSILNVKNNKENSKLPPTTLDLLFMRVAATTPGMSTLSGEHDNKNSLDILMHDKKIYNFFKIKNQYNNDSLLYEMDSEKIDELKRVMKKRHPLYYKCLQKTDKLFYSK